MPAPLERWTPEGRIQMAIKHSVAKMYHFQFFLYERPQPGIHRDRTSHSTDLEPGTRQVYHQFTVKPNLCL